MSVRQRVAAAEADVSQMPKVKRLPVFQSTSCSGISDRILAMKLRPVQCIGITTSGVIVFNSAMVCARHSL